MADLARAFVSFFAIIDPVGNVLVFHLYTRALPLRSKVQVALIAIGAAFVMLLFFSVGGLQALSFLGITAESFRVAAGLLLLPPAFRLVMEGQPTDVDHQAALEPTELALVPLAMPLIAGPGALAAAISFSRSVGIWTTIGAFSMVLFISLVAFVLADWLFASLGPSLLRLLSRLVGIVLFAIAVNFVLSGVYDFVAK